MPGGGFGAQLRTLRERAGLTQEQLAERAGLSANAVSALERGVRRYPYPHTRDALARALGLSPAERDAFEPHRRPRGTHLPVPSSSLVGRDDDVAAVAELLTAHRIVTLTGPGGVGKTRLALAVAGQVADRYAGGTVFASLASVRETADVPATLAAALQVGELGPRDLVAVLRRHVRARRLLLVVDNLEHLAGAAHLLTDLVEASPSLTLLLTSRAPVGLGGERAYPVNPLAPADARALFLERAQQAGADSTLHPATDVDLLCARLDHLPLAIELVAARAPLLSSAHLLSRLDAIVRSDVPARHDLPERQRTLAATVQWSCDLLPQPARLLVRRLAVLASPWTAPAAAAISAVADTPGLDLHLRLAQHSLVSPVGRGDEPRFTMPATVRAVLSEELAVAGELPAAQERHAAWFLRRLGESGTALWSGRQAAELAELEAEHDDLRAAARFLLARGEVDALAEAWWSAILFWLVRGHLSELHGWATGALPSARTAGTRARLHYLAGWSLLPHGRHDAAAVHFQASVAEARRADAPVELGWALVGLVNAEVYRGRPEAAFPLLAEAGHLAERTADPHLDSCLLIGAAHVQIAAGDLAGAASALAGALRDVEDRGAPWPLGVVLGILGRLLLGAGKDEEAGALLHRSVRIFAELGDTWGMAHQLTHVADAAGARGDHVRAALLYGAVEALADEVGEGVFPVWQQRSDRHRAEALTTLGVDRYTGLLRQGRSLSPADVVATALGEPLSPAPAGEEDGVAGPRG